MPEEVKLTIEQKLSRDRALLLRLPDGRFALMNAALQLQGVYEPTATLADLEWSIGPMAKVPPAPAKTQPHTGPRRHRKARPIDVDLGDL